MEGNILSEKKIKHEKIAIVTESSCDLPTEIIEKYQISVVPLRIIYPEKEYSDGVDITPEEVYARMPGEIPTTSLPSYKDISTVYNRLRNEGFKKILSIHLSAELSGTVNLIRMIAKEYDDMEIEVIDSKNVSIGVGLLVYQAAKYIEAGINFKEISEKLQKFKENVKVFFCIPVLDYLKKGGRIGLVSATLGTLLDLKPIISVNLEGKYYTHAKVRGRKNALEKMVEIVSDLIDSKDTIVFVYHGAAEEDALVVKAKFAAMSNVKEIFSGKISPSMGVHTGPGLIGIGYMPATAVVE